MTRSLLASLPLELAGWEFEGPTPTEKKFVILAAPHTSNYDGLLLLALTRSIGLPISWMIKREWVRGPMGVLLRQLGAVAIDRRGANDVVEKMIDTFAKKAELALAIPPEGTRKRAEHWRSGFYHIAMGARVPVVPGYLDYRRKRGGLGPPVHLTGNMRADMDVIRAYYAKMAPIGHVPDDFGPIRLKDEG